MNPTSPVARFIAARILGIGKSQKDIAREVGFESANVITMIKQGATKLPLSRVSAMAKALETDPLQLLSMCFEEYQPETWEAIAPLMQSAVTNDELHLLRALRKLAGGPYLSALSDEAKGHLDRLVVSLSAAASVH